MSELEDLRALVKELAEGIFLVDRATVPKGKQPCEAPDQVVGSLVIMGRTYQKILDAAKGLTDDVDEH